LLPVDRPTAISRRHVGPETDAPPATRTAAHRETTFRPTTGIAGGDRSNAGQATRPALSDACRGGPDPGFTAALHYADWADDRSAGPASWRCQATALVGTEWSSPGAGLPGLRAGFPVSSVARGNLPGTNSNAGERSGNGRPQTVSRGHEPSVRQVG